MTVKRTKTKRIIKSQTKENNSKETKNKENKSKENKSNTHTTIIDNKSNNPNIKEKCIYFDNNGTTLICSKAEKIMMKWLKCYNPSSDFTLANGAKKLLKYAEEYIEDHCHTANKYTIIFTSGATESNCSIIRMIADAYYSNFFEKPHIVTSLMEHKSIISCLQSLEKMGIVEVTYVIPTIHGVITPTSIKEAIKDNTCLVTIMYANNELGTINDIPAIAKITHTTSNGKFKIPFHTDAVQLFGKHRIKLLGENKNGDMDIDVLSMSFHKLYGPKGIGLLIIKKDLIAQDGFGLNALITGSQQYGLRGGTENIPAIAGGIEALKHTFKNRKEKNKHLLKLKKLMLDLLSKKYKFSDYRDYIDYPNDKDRDKIELVLLGPPNYEKKVLPNTILLSIVKNKGKNFCNVKFKKKLNKNGIAISIGSACLTDDKKSSHVLDSINAPDIIKRGVIRISFSDDNTESEVKRFVKVFNKLLKEEC